MDCKTYNFTLKPIFIIKNCSLNRIVMSAKDMSKLEVFVTVCECDVNANTS